METCPTTHRVLSVRCQFCVYFGVEIDPTKIRKRGPRTTTMAWIGSFRCDKYTEHHGRLHPARWALYKACSSAEKTRFFDDVTPLANTMLPHVNVGSAATFKFNIQLPIVDCFIGDMFFHPDDQGGITQKRALKSFKRVDDHYEVVIPNRDQFRLVIKSLSRGVSFRQCVRIHDDIKEVLGITFKLRQLSNSNRCKPNWQPHRHESRQLCTNCSGPQSPTYHHYPRSSKEPIRLGILLGKRRVNPLRQIVPRQPHPSPRRRETPQLSSRRHPHVRGPHRREHVLPRRSHS